MLIFEKLKRKSWKFKLVCFFWAIFGMVVIAIFTTFLVLSRDNSLPTLEQLEHPPIALATEILSRDGEVIGKIYNENRKWITRKEIPQSLIDAVVATEDERFFNHSGIDARSFLRAIGYFGKKGGGSTITQQLAKLLFHERNYSNFFETITQKLKEWIIAFRLEKRYTKDEILTMYLNKMDFLRGGKGIEAAARVYFDKNTLNLNIQESAMFAAMLKGPELYNPVSRNVAKTTRALQRRNVVFSQMYRNNYLTKSEKDSLQKLPLKTNFNKNFNVETVAPYFTKEVRNFVKNWSAQKKEFANEYYNVFEDGLRIYTTIDSKLQKVALKSVRKHLSGLQKAYNNIKGDNPFFPFQCNSNEEYEILILRLMKKTRRWSEMVSNGFSIKDIRKSFYTKKKIRLWNGVQMIDSFMTPVDSIKYYHTFLNAGFLALDSKSGAIKAWVGGVDYRKSQYDNVKQSKRQVGSTFKPIVYATAIDQLHHSPCDSFPNLKYTVKESLFCQTDEWSPSNSNEKYGGNITLKDALANSVNVIAAKLIDQVGIEKVIQVAKKMGISEEIPCSPTIALGTTSISLYEMLGAYTVFSNKGLYTKPYYIDRIEDSNGNVLYENEINNEEVFDEEVISKMKFMMEEVSIAGTAKILRGKGRRDSPFFKEIITDYPYDFKFPIACKTGTTQNNSDGWFIGMTSDLLAGAWVGGSIPSVRFRSTKYGMGATMALPIWGSFYKNCIDKGFLDYKNLSYSLETMKYDCDNLEIQSEEESFD